MALKRYAVDIIALCRTLIERAAFCGQSAGSMQQLTMALAAPQLVAASVLCFTSYYLSAEVRDLWRKLTPELLAEGDDRANIAAYRATHVLQPDQWRKVQVACLAMSDHPHGDDFPELSELSRITAPTLKVSKNRDEYFPSSGTASVLDLAQRRVLRAAEHGVADSGAAQVCLRE